VHALGPDGVRPRPRRREGVLEGRCMKARALGVDPPTAHWRSRRTRCRVPACREVVERPQQPRFGGEVVDDLGHGPTVIAGGDPATPARSRSSRSSGDALAAAAFSPLRRPKSTASRARHSARWSITARRPASPTMSHRSGCARIPSL
jgi:hypothetical protein